MPSKDVLDHARQEGPIPKGIGLKVMEGSRDGNLVRGYRVGTQGGVDKLVSDDDQLMFKVTRELDGEQSGGKCYARLGMVVSVPCSSGLLCILCTGDQVH